MTVRSLDLTAVFISFWPFGSSGTSSKMLLLILSYVSRQLLIYTTSTFHLEPNNSPLAAKCPTMSTSWSLCQSVWCGAGSVQLVRQSREQLLAVNKDCSWVIIIHYRSNPFHSVCSHVTHCYDKLHCRDLMQNPNLFFCLCCLPYDTKWNQKDPDPSVMRWDRQKTQEMVLGPR